MVSMFMTMFFSIIIAPFLYLLYIIRQFPFIYKLGFSIISLIALGTMFTKIVFKIDNNFFFIISKVSQFYIIFMIIMAIFCLIFQIVNHFVSIPYQGRFYIGLIVIALLITGIGFYSHDYKTIKNYEIFVNKDSQLKELNVGMLSDIHLGTGTYIPDLEKLVQQINSKNYDVYFLCGDIFDEGTPETMINPALKILSQIQTKYGTYAVSGNHEYYANLLDASPYVENNIHYLSDTYVSIQGLFNIVGREDETLKDGLTMEEICKDIDTSLPTFVLDHNPRRYKDSIPFVDVQFSGHTHNGQFFPGSLITNRMYDNAYGLLQKDSYSLIVSSGYGSWGFPFRLLTNCELVETKVTFSKK